VANRRNWTEDEVRHALALYLRTAFGRFDKGNPDIIDLAARLGRTPSAVTLKLANLAALDASIPQKGMSNASAMDKQVWTEFFDNPEPVLGVFDQQIAGIAASSTAQQRLRHPVSMAEESARYDAFGPSERKVEATQRIGQDFFRRIILVSYSDRCALTGIEDKRLLNASHIVAWKDDPRNRLNPSNGVCLNALHDRAFDRHMITFDEDYRMKIAAHVPVVARRELERVETGKLELPNRFLPNQAFLEKHRRAFHDIQAIS
jgi:putative restriction endonuclease